MNFEKKTIKENSFLLNFVLVTMLSIAQKPTKMASMIRQYLIDCNDQLGIGYDQVWNAHYIPICKNSDFVNITDDQFDEIYDKAEKNVKYKERSMNLVRSTWHSMEIIVEMHDILKINSPFKSAYTPALGRCPF